MKLKIQITVPSSPYKHLRHSIYRQVVMLNYKSVRSSAPQIRSNPALRQVSVSSGFQKRLSTLLEPMEPPFPTFQILKETNKQQLEDHQYYGWVRPARLRSQWIVLSDEMPLLMQDPRNKERLWSLRIPVHKRDVQKVGPVVLEGAWDPQDHVLWIWDVLVWEKANVWSVLPYSKRWQLLHTIVDTLLEKNHPMSDAEIRLPEWKSLESMKTYIDLDSASSVEFQPEKAGQRRLLYLIRDDAIAYRPQSHHERKMDATGGPIQYKPTHKPARAQIEHHVSATTQPQSETNSKPSESQTRFLPHMGDQPKANTPVKPVSNQTNTPSTDVSAPIERQRIGRLKKDTYSNLPDSYRLQSIQGDDLGLAAIRSLDISKQLREKFKSSDSVLADILWFEPFQKYEVKKVHA